MSISTSDRDGKTLEQISAVRGYSEGKLQASDSFPQSSYVRWSTTQYGSDSLVSSQWAYHNIPSTGAGESGTDYDQTDFGYDTMARQNKQVTPGGTITRTVFDPRGNGVQTWVGTDDTGATESDPTGGGAMGNNMVLVSSSEFDNGLDGGDNNQTMQTQHVDASTSRVTTFLFDWRNRLTDTDGEVDFYQCLCHDNLDRVLRTDRHDTTAAGNLVLRSENCFDDLGRVFLSIRYGVDPATGAVGNALRDNTWFDDAGNAIKVLPSGSSLFTKTVFDGIGRSTKEYRGYDLDETGYAEAGTVEGDTILEQSEMAYDDASHVIQVSTRLRYHDATGTGELGTPSSSQPRARVMYTATWHDGIGRMVASADYGTNGGSALVRPETIPERSDTCLVVSTGYSSAGDVFSITDPMGIVTCFTHDDLGREVMRMLNCRMGSSSSSSASSSSSSSSGGCGESDDTNVTVLTTYNPDGNVSVITAVNSATGNQVTQFLYGTTLEDSDIASSLLKRAEIFPDSVDEDDRIRFGYNRQSQVIEMRDQNGTIHDYDYDKLGTQSRKDRGRRRKEECRDCDRMFS